MPANAEPGGGVLRQRRAGLRLPEHHREEQHDPRQHDGGKERQAGNGGKRGALEQHRVDGPGEGGSGDQQVAGIEAERTLVRVQRDHRDAGESEHRPDELAQADRPAAEPPLQEQDHDVGGGVDQRGVGRGRRVQREIDRAAADPHAEEAEERRRAGPSALSALQCATSPRPANGSRIRKAPDQRRKASVHGPTSATSDRPITTFVEKNSGTSTITARSRSRPALICMGRSGFPREVFCGNARREAGQADEFAPPA